MQPIWGRAKRGLRAAVAATLAALLFLAGLVAQVPELHRLLHNATHGDDPGCVICQVAHGEFAAPAAFVLAAPAPRPATLAILPVGTVVAQGLMFTVALGQGPPVRFAAR